MKKGRLITRREAEVLETLLESATWKITRHIDEWPSDIMSETISDMWGGFWQIVPPDRITQF